MTKTAKDVARSESGMRVRHGQIPTGCFGITDSERAHNSFDERVGEADRFENSYSSSCHFDFNGVHTTADDRDRLGEASQNEYPALR